MANDSVIDVDLKMQSKQHYISYLHTGNLDDLDRAVRCAQRVLDGGHPDVPPTPDVYYNLARPLFRRFLHARQDQDIAKAISMLRRASRLLADDDPMRWKYHRYLIIYYFVRGGRLDRFLELKVPEAYCQSKPSSELETTLIFNLGEGDELFCHLQSTMLKAPLPPQPSLEDIDSAIQLSRQALQFYSPPSSDPVKISEILFHLGTLLNLRYAKHRQPEDNNQAIDCFCRALGLGLPNYRLGYCLTFASMAYKKRFDAMGAPDLEDLNNAEDLCKQAMTVLEAGDNAKRAMKIFRSRHECFPMCLDNLGKIVFTRYREGREVDPLTVEMDSILINRGFDIQEGSNFEEARSIPLNDLAENLRTGSRRPANRFIDEAELKEQSKKLYISYLLSGNLDDLEQAMRCAQDVLAVMPTGVPPTADVLYNLARPLFRKFLHTGQAEDIMTAIELFRHASQLLTGDNPVRQKCYDYLIVSYFVRESDFKRFARLNATQGDSQSRFSRMIESTLVFNLGESDEVFNYVLHTMFRSRQPPSYLPDVDSAIQLSQQALKFFSPPPSNPVLISILLFHLGHLSSMNSDLQGKLEGIREATDCFRRALKLGLPTLLLGNCLTSASGELVKLFDALGEQEGHLGNADTLARQAMRLFEAVYNANEVLQIFDSPHAGFAECLNNLARVMFSRHLAEGENDDLNAAIDALNSAVDIAHSETKSELPILLNNLASILRFRSERTGQTDDMEMSIKMLQRAVELWEPDDPRRIQSYANLSYYEYRQGVKASDNNLMNQAVKHIQEGFSLGGQDLGSNPGLDLPFLNTLASFGFRNLSDVEVWKASMKLAQVGASPSFAHHPVTGHSHALLCVYLHSGWRRTNDPEYLDRAISTADSMIKLAQPWSQQSMWGRKILGDCLHDRYKRKGHDEDRERAVEVLLEGFHISAALPFYRIMAGQMAIDILSEQADWKRAHELSLQIVDLLVILNGRSLGWHDKQFLMQLFSHQAATYVSIALEAESEVLDVVNMLETCRGSILGHLIDSRTDLDDLTNVAPELADRFRALQVAIHLAIDSSGTMTTRVDQSTRKCEAEVNMRACLTEIRALEGFERFLLGPSPSELREAAARGPIVFVNITDIRSDAILITENSDPVSLRLRNLKYKDAENHLKLDLSDLSNIMELGKKNQKYRQLLKWLWNNCVELIFKELGNLGIGSAKFHVWWIGIGIASSLPFHAAGVYSEHVSATSLVRAVSSYTPTVKILLYGRRKLKNDRSKSKPQKPRLKIITMPSTPGMSDLIGVTTEASEVENAVGDVYSTEIILQPNAEEAKASMAESEVVHFACHGESILKDPSRSRLLLQVRGPDSATAVVDELTVRDVAAIDLRHGKLAFLSACSTAQNRLTYLQDEALHLASGFQVAGYLHAVGNLWPADDDVSVEIVKGFYHHLVAAGEFDYGRHVAEALNEATIDVAGNEEYARQPLSWALFVHFGV